MTLRKWAAGIAAFVLLTTLAGNAAATTYYVNASWLIQDERNVAGTSAYMRRLAARDGRAGTSSALCWGTITKANATVKSGDVVMVEHNDGGMSMAMPDPACQDTVGEHTPEAGVPTNPWVTYIGEIEESVNPHHPKPDVVGDSIRYPYVSIKGLQIMARAEAFTFRGDRDSVQYCDFSAPIEWGTSDYSYYGNNQFTGWRFRANACGANNVSPYECMNDDSTVTGTTWESNHFTGMGAFDLIGVDSCFFNNNTFEITANASDVPTVYVYMRHSNNINFYRNRWNYLDLLPSEGEFAHLFRARDGVTNLTFRRDSVFSLTTTPPVAYYISASGNNANGAKISDRNATYLYDSCYVHIKNSVGGMVQQHPVNGLAMTYNTIINESGPAVTMNDGMKGKAVFDHNTFVGLATPSVFAFGEGTPVDVRTPPTWWDSVTVTNNIFYALNKTLPRETSAAINYEVSMFDSLFYANRDSTEAHVHDGHLWSDHNLYSYFAPADTVGQRSIRMRMTDEGESYYAWPGGNAVNFESMPDSVNIVAGSFADSVIIHMHPLLGDTTFTVSVGRRVVTPPTSGKVATLAASILGDPIRSGLWAKWCPSCDDSSTYGSPKFTATPDTGGYFDASLRAGSLAHGLGSDSSDAGAITYVHPTELTYDVGRTDFEAFPGSDPQTCVIGLRNEAGCDSLHVTGVALVDPESKAKGDFAFSATSVAVGPGDYSQITVTFTPDAAIEPAGRYVEVTYDGASIAFSTNDPANPTISIPVSISSWEAK